MKLEKPTVASNSTNPNFNTFVNKKKKPDPNVSDITVNFNIASNNDSKNNNNNNNNNTDNKSKTNKSAPSTPTTPSTPPPSSEDTNSTTIDPSKWPADKQSLLEKAMRKYPTAMGDERWDKIASEISGMTRKDCILRYKYLVAFFKQQQQQKK